MDNVNTFPFWRAISKSRRSANRVLSSQPRIYRLASKSEDSEDALATNRSKASIPNANSRESIECYEKATEEMQEELMNFASNLGTS
jgi:hypothetical protein